MSKINDSVLCSLLLSIGTAENAKQEALLFAKALVESDLCVAARCWVSNLFLPDKTEMNQAVNFASFPESNTVQSSVNFSILYEALILEGFISDPPMSVFPIERTNKHESRIVFWLGDLGLLELIRNESQMGIFSLRSRFKGKDYEKLAPVFEKFTKQLKNKLNETKITVNVGNKSRAIRSSDVFRSKYLQNKHLNTLSHELRNPFNILLGYIGLLSETKLTNEQKEFCEIINIAANDLFSIVTKVVQFLKLELDKFVLDDMPVDFVLLIQEIEKNYQPIAQKKRINLGLEVDPSINMKLLGDSSKLTDTLMYLMDNAFKFTSSGKVWLKASKLDENESEIVVNVEVSDTGIGIETDLTRDILNFFVQEDDSILRNYGGLGLGLSIANAYVSRMGGELKLRSKKGAGTTVGFTLTLKKYKGSDYARYDVLNINMDIAKELKVLVVDDDAYQRDLGLRILQGWNTYFATNGQEAIDFLRKNPDTKIVLMDIRMPVLDGISAVRVIRNELKHKALVFAVSGEMEEGTIEECLEAGMDAFVSKPYNREKLFRIIRFKYQRNDLFKLAKQQKYDPYRLDDLKALIVEDNKMNQLVITRQLNNVGCITDLARDGATAESLIEKSTYDFVLLDLYLPDIEGVELAPKLRKHQTDLCVIAYSSDDSEYAIRKCHEAQIMNHIQKKYQKSADLAYLINQAIINHRRFLDENHYKPTPKALYSLVQINEIVGENSDDLKQIVKAFTEYIAKLVEDMKGYTYENKVEIKRVSHTILSSAIQYQMTSILPLLRKLESEIDSLSNGEIESYLDQVVIYLSESIQQMINEVLDKE